MSSGTKDAVRILELMCPDRLCTATTEATPEVQRLVKEVVRHKRRFEQVALGRGGGGEPLANELGSFWLRKTHKCVLSMLMVKPDGDEEPTFYSGMNIEVSMPTGSLCSERNAMGQTPSPTIYKCSWCTLMPGSLIAWRAGVAGQQVLRFHPTQRSVAETSR